MICDNFFLLGRLWWASDMFQKRFPPGCKPLRLTKYDLTAENWPVRSEDHQFFRAKPASARIDTSTTCCWGMGRLTQVHRNAVVMWATPINNDKLSQGGLGLRASAIKRRLYKVFNCTTTLHTLKSKVSANRLTHLNLQPVLCYSSKRHGPGGYGAPPRDQ